MTKAKVETAAREQAVAALAEALRLNSMAPAHAARGVMEYLDANPAAKALLCAALMPDDGHLCCCLEGDDDDAHGRDGSLEQPLLRGRYSDTAPVVTEEWRAFLIAHARDLHGCEHDFGGDEMRLRPIVGPDMGTEREPGNWPCEMCDGSGRLTFNGQKRACPTCGGSGWALAAEPMSSEVGPDMGTERRAFTVEDNPFRAEPMSSEVANNETALDVERLARAIYEAQRPEGWPTWEEYLDSFAHGPTQQDVWLTRAAKVAAEYDRLAVRDDEEPRT